MRWGHTYLYCGLCLLLDSWDLHWRLQEGNQRRPDKWVDDDRQWHLIGGRQAQVGRQGRQGFLLLWMLSYCRPFRKSGDEKVITYPYANVGNWWGHFQG